MTSYEITHGPVESAMSSYPQNNLHIRGFSLLYPGKTSARSISSLTPEMYIGRSKTEIQPLSNRHSRFSVQFGSGDLEIRTGSTLNWTGVEIRPITRHLK